MKNTAKISMLIAVVMSFAIVTKAQVTASASSSATIVTPIAITKTVDMNFGNVAVSTAAGTVVLAPAGSRTKTGGVTLPATAGTVTAASFTVTGTPTYTYAITLPSTATTITRGGGTETMTVDNWSSSPATTGTLSSGGSETLTVGGTLNVGGSQLAGTYVSGTPFNVTVNYN